MRLIKRVVNEVLRERKSEQPEKRRYPRGAPGAKPVKAKLTATLSEGSSATATIWKHNGTSVVDTEDQITVYDWYLGTGESLPSGTKVWAAKMQDGKYWAIRPEFVLGCGLEYDGNTLQLNPGTVDSSVTVVTGVSCVDDEIVVTTTTLQFDACGLFIGEA